MHLLVISKLYPLVGQVSTLNLWLSKGLVDLGHSLAFCTDTRWVAEAYRCQSNGMPNDLFHIFGHQFASNRLNVKYTDQWTENLFYIPPSEPRVSLLVNAALSAIEEHNTDVIFAHYLEPYAIAGFIVSKLVNKPLVITHAGSDIGKLASTTGLRKTYSSILNSSRVFVPKSQAAAALGHGVIAAPKPKPYFPDPTFFYPRGKDTVTSSSAPCLGFYGKLAHGKSLLTLIQALTILRNRGLDFKAKFVGSPLPNFAEDWARATEAAPWLESINFIPNWEIPDFIRSCDLSVYLKDGYLTTGHVSIIPKEILACGGRLVTTPESINMPWCRDYLQAGDNYDLVANATDPVELANALADAIKAIQHRERLPLAHVDWSGGYHDFVESWEAIFHYAAEDRQ